jgi:hypothetical protein
MRASTAAARSSAAGLSGEKAEETATAPTPEAAMARAAASIPASSKGAIGRPSYS